MEENTAKLAEDAEKKTEAEKKAELIRETQKKQREALEAAGEGKGRLRLEKPIRAGDEELTELIYDFMELTGSEYTDALDSDPRANQMNRITYRQALAMFAKAAAKQTKGVDARDIIERIGVTDAAIGTQLAMIFFTASTRAGQLRICKK